MNGIRLFVGLGNPGAEYETTRHNAGFWWVDEVAHDTHSRLNAEAKFFGRTARSKVGPTDVWLLQPTTFMNASGRSVAALARFYRIEPEQILVIHDELDLAPGTVKLKQGGGNGGHNGLKDIAAQLGTPNFWRLRLGIGNPGERNAVVDYVLNAPSRTDAGLIEDNIHLSAQLLPMLVAGQFEAAMLKLHTKPKPA